MDTKNVDIANYLGDLIAGKSSYPIIVDLPNENESVLSAVCDYAGKHGLMVIAYCNIQYSMMMIWWNVTAWQYPYHPVTYWKPVLLDRTIRIWPIGTPKEIYEKEAVDATGKTREIHHFCF